MKRLKIRIYSDGYIQMETEGIKGEKCEEYFPFFKKLLNNRIVDQVYTEEFYQKCAEEEKIVEGVRVKS